MAVSLPEFIANPYQPLVEAAPAVPVSAPAGKTAQCPLGSDGAGPAFANPVSITVPCADGLAPAKGGVPTKPANLILP